jgi:hypothetical protein
MAYYCQGFRPALKASVSSLDLIGFDGKDTKVGIDVGKFTGLTAACTAGATAAAAAAGKSSALVKFKADEQLTASRRVSRRLHLQSRILCDFHCHLYSSFNSVRQSSTWRGRLQSRWRCGRSKNRWSVSDQS